MKYYRIGVLLDSWKYPDETIECLKSLENCQYDYLQITDNASSMEDYLKVYNWCKESYKKHFTAFRFNEEVSLSKALNHGLRTMLEWDCGYIAWIHADMAFPDFLWMAKLKAFLETHPDIAKVAPITTAHGKDYDKPIGNNFVRGNSCPWLISRKSLIDVHEKYGSFFDERYQKLEFEDWDFNNRLVNCGYNVVIWDGARVKHDGAVYRFKSELQGFYDGSRQHNAELYKKIWGIDYPLV